MEIILAIVATALVTSLVALVWNRHSVFKAKRAADNAYIALVRKESTDLYNKLRRDMDSANANLSDLLGSSIEEFSGIVGSVEGDVAAIVTAFNALAAAHDTLVDNVDLVQVDLDQLRTDNVTATESIEQLQAELDDLEISEEIVEEIELPLAVPPTPEHFQHAHVAPSAPVSRRENPQANIAPRREVMENPPTPDPIEPDDVAPVEVRQEGQPMITDLRPTPFKEAPPDETGAANYALNTAAAGVEEHRPGNPRNSNPFKRFR